MKFIKLEIQNLASLDRQGGEVINFQEGVLGDSTIFSIVGPTGSGKSTILDAICLALYNRAPRYPRKKGDRNQNIEIFGEPEEGEKNRLAPTDSRNILTRGKKEGYSKLTFLANNGNVYRAEWSVCKKTKNYDNAITSLYLITTKDGVTTEEPAEWDKLPQIIGLDYDQFLRTVLIAQGSFASFLKADENDRYALLEKLIGCEELYTNIAAKIKQQKDDAVAQYNQIAAKYEAQDKDVIKDEEVLTALENRIAELEAEEKKVKEELGKVSEALAWYATEEKHKKDIQKYEKAFNEAKKQLEALQPQAKLLALHDETLQAVSHFKEMKTAEGNIATLAAKLNKLSSDKSLKKDMIETEEKMLKPMQQAVQDAADELERQRPHINNARTIKAELQPLEQALNEKYKKWQDSKTVAETALQKVTDKSIDLNTAAECYEQENRILVERNKQNQARLASPDLDPTNLRYEVQTLRESRALINSDNLQQLRQELVDGKPCPLCGAVHHPYHSAEEYHKVTTELDKMIEEKDKDIRRIDEEAKELSAQLSTNDPLYKRVEMLRLAVEAKQKHDEAETDQKAYEQAKEKVEYKKEALKREIGDKDPDTYEKQLTKAKEDAEKEVETKNLAIANLRKELQILQGQEEATTNQHETERANHSKAESQLTEWLTLYNASKQQDQLTINIIDQLYTATDDWEQIRSEQRRLSQAYTSAETTLKNEKNAHAEHQNKKPEQTKEQLTQRKAELEAKTNNELVESRARHQRHETAKTLMEAMSEKKLETESLKNEWEQITDAIGGDGKTLRKIAQCYTLRFLIEHANAEIRKFNSRYELLQVKNSLGLRVIDHDRADDVRDITSLSGGETFIVSLGLALGLSSLSSRNISFENLFIDEGFGTLDPDTLATVIDSLAMLQSSQGKKVGVISHTDTMSERITTQIRIIKNGNSGSSHIEIYP